MEITNASKDNIISLKKKVKCPTCKKKVSKEPFTPFCTKKCAELDLMKWLTDEHQVNLETS